MKQRTTEHRCACAITLLLAARVQGKDSAYQRELNRRHVDPALGKVTSKRAGHMMRVADDRADMRSFQLRGGR